MCVSSAPGCTQLEGIEGIMCTEARSRFAVIDTNATHCTSAPQGRSQLPGLPKMQKRTQNDKKNRIKFGQPRQSQSKSQFYVYIPYTPIEYRLRPPQPPCALLKTINRSNIEPSSGPPKDTSPSRTIEAIANAWGQVTGTQQDDIFIEPRAPRALRDKVAVAVRFGFGFGFEFRVGAGAAASSSSWLWLRHWVNVSR